MMLEERRSRSRRSIPSLSRTLALAAAVALLAGCAGRENVTKTERSAIEQALLTQSAEDVFEELLPVDAAGRSFFMIDGGDGLKIPDKHYLIGSLRLHLLASGLTEAQKNEEADILVTPRVYHAGTDESEFLLGIPSIPIPVMGVTYNTPELAIFKRAVQRGRNRMAAFGVERTTGKLAFSIVPHSKERYFASYTILFFFKWRTTDLDEPF